MPRPDALSPPPLQSLRWRIIPDDKSIPSSALLAVSGWGAAFIYGHLADVPQPQACYATSVTLRGGGLTAFLPPPPKKGAEDGRPAIFRARCSRSVSRSVFG